MNEKGRLIGWIVQNAAEVKAIGSSAIVLGAAAYLYIAGLIKERQRLQKNNKPKMSKEVRDYYNRLGF